jgi:acyl-coenzyme A thioesterase PaaI-like protein
MKAAVIRAAPVSDPAAPRLSAEDIQGHFDASPFMSFLGLPVAHVDHDRGELTVTMAMRPEIERGAGPAQFHGRPTARVRRSGRTVTVVDIDVHDEGNALVAIGCGTYSSQRG